MPRRPALLVLVAALGCGAPPVEESPLASAAESIINGQPCAAGEQPATVAILVDTTLEIPGYPPQPLKTVVCTGTLIAPDVVVAAAHCVDPAVLGEGFATPRDTKYFITFEPDLGDLAEQKTTTFPADSIPVTSWVEHPQFALDGSVNGPGNFHDVSLLFLDRALTVRPEAIITAAETSQIAEGKPVAIAGWGQQTVTGQFEPPPAGTVGRKICANTKLGTVGAFEMQVGGDQTTARKCHGDSGGPTFLDVETTTLNKRRLIGITSHAYDQSDCRRGGVDTRVDAVRDWIDDRMRMACDAGSRVWCTEKGILAPTFGDAPAPQPSVDPGSAGDAPAGCGGCASTSPVAALSLGPLALRRRRGSRASG
jgi:hypothetical protein